MNNLFVRQLNFATSSETLRPLFEQYGELLEVKVPMEAPGKNKGFGFVTFKFAEDAARAIQALNGHVLDGKNIVVAVSNKAGSAPPPSLPPQHYPPPYAAASSSAQQHSQQQRLRSPPRNVRRERSPRPRGREPVVSAYAPPPTSQQPSVSSHRGGERAYGNARASYNSFGGPKSSDTSMDGKIYVSGLPPNTTEEMLEEFFGASGKIARKRQGRGYPDQWPPNIKLYCTDQGEFRGDALVTYEDPNASLTAPGFFDQADFHGSTITVQVATREH